MSGNEVSGKEVYCPGVFYLLVEVLLGKWIINKKKSACFKPSHFGKYRIVKFKDVADSSLGHCVVRITSKSSQV